MSSTRRQPLSVEGLSLGGKSIIPLLLLCRGRGLLTFAALERGVDRVNGFLLGWGILPNIRNRLTCEPINIFTSYLSVCHI